ncbi:MAG: DUF3368 domain-containing protein [bacterium]
MIVVSNTSPIMNLAVIGQLNLLERLYGRVFIPEAVIQELSVIKPEEHKLPIIKIPSWIESRAVKDSPLVHSIAFELDTGEAEAIVLATELKADLLLIDERRGRVVSSRMGLKFIGLLGVLIEAKHKGFIVAIKPILDTLISKAGFWISGQLYNKILQTADE